jgi:hypothetical protein
MQHAQPNKPTADPAVDATQRGESLVLVKNDQRYVFQCAAGQEQALIQQLRDMAEDPQHALGWFDAAVLCHQLGQRIKVRLQSEGP